MKKLLVVLLGSLLFLSGCLNITNEMFLEKDGSGTYRITMKMDKLQEIMEMAKQYAPDSLQGMDFNKVMEDSIRGMVKDLSTIPGITEVKNENPDKTTTTVSFKFKDIKSLNTALKRRNGTAADIYSVETDGFICHDKSMGELGNMMDELKKSKDIPGGNSMPDLDPEQIKQMMQLLGWEMTMTNIYHFPQKVKTMSNKKSVLSQDGKTVTLSLNLLEDNTNNSLENKIKW